MKTTFLTLATTAALCLSASAAHAKQGLAVGLDVGPNFVVEDLAPGADSAGIGFNGRLGYQFDGGVLRLTPEAKVGFESPGAPDALRVMGGIRMSFLKGLQPVAFAHLGGLIGDLEGFAWDIGGGLDFAAGPFMIGANVSYNRVEEQEFSFANLTDDPGADAYEWIQVAASVGFVF
jgi:opacity protein-like surface antigen